jgi:hypothetical protein
MKRTNLLQPMKLYLSYETLDQIKIQMESLESQNYQTPYLTFEEDNSIEGLEGNYKVSIIATHSDPIGGSTIITIDCLGDVKETSY